MSRRGVVSALALSSAALFAVACSDDPVSPDATTAPDAARDAGPSVFPDAAEDAGGSPDTGGETDSGIHPDAGSPDALPGDAVPPRSIVFIHTNDEHSHELGFAPEVDDVPSARSTAASAAACSVAPSSSSASSRRPAPAAPACRWSAPATR